MTAPDPMTLFGLAVIDATGAKVGTVDHVFLDDSTEELEFIGVKMGWLLGKTHIVPIVDASFSDTSVTLPYTTEQVKASPDSGDESLNPKEEEEIYRHFGIIRSVPEDGPDTVAHGVAGRDGGDLTVETTPNPA